MMQPDLASVAAQARDWLYSTALPLWLGEGFDRSPAPFAERVSADGRALDIDRRLRVQARQTYVCAEAGRLGWHGDWRTPLRAGVDLLTGKGRRADGAFVHLFTATGDVADSRADLYDHAFALFALARAAPVLERTDLEAVIESGWQWLDANWAHPLGGYREGEIEPADIRRQNPHMHLLEAAVAFYEAFPRSSGMDRANALSRLFHERFFDDGYGALPEYFDDAWNRLPDDRGRITEPGHQFEWAWLLRRHALAAPGVVDRSVTERLIAHGLRYGIDQDRGVAVNEVWIEGQVRDPRARLWPQTERLKAALSDPATSRGETGEASAAAIGLFRYLDRPVPGIWRDMMDVAGGFDSQAAPASSLYHIVCALAELIRADEQPVGE